MNKLILFSIIAVCIVLLFSGCVQPPGPDYGTCGNGICDAGETAESCAGDCPMPPVPAGTGGNAGQPPSLPF